MNTPLQQLRDKLNEHLKTMVGKQPYDNGYKSALVDIMYLIDEFKESEKQAIIDAYNQGRVNEAQKWRNKSFSRNLNEAEQYYNQKYKQS